MSVSRRSFFKVLGLTGVALATGKELNANPPEINDKELHGILYDSTRCAGCRSCEYSCAESSNLPAPPDDIAGIRTPDEVYRTVVNEYNRKGNCRHALKTVRMKR